MRNQELLKLIATEPSSDTDDFLEREALNGSEDAKKLLTIEHATEIAKQIIQGHYEDILRAIRSESTKKEDAVYRCKNTDNIVRTSYDIEYVHLETAIDESGGHAIYLKVNNKTKQITVYDSMGEDAYLNEFEDVVRDTYPEYKIRDKSIGFQPTGGFTQDSPEQMAGAMYVSGEPGYLNRAWKVSQYDELSQHHFCYIEAFMAMAFDSLPMYRKGPDDPRERLRFIKRVAWGFVHKFYKGPREGVIWRYFTEHFPYYMSTWNTDGTRMRMRNDTFQIPKKESFIRRVEKIDMVDTTGWSIKDILTWAAKT